MEDNSSVVFTLSSSFVAFPNKTLAALVKKFTNKQTTCKVWPYLECTFKDNAQLAEFLAGKINLDFDTSIISFYLDELVLKREGRKVKLNIK
jgi:hypothetical protein